MEQEVSGILRLLEDGKITADEAERLIRAARSARESAPSPSHPTIRHEPADSLSSILRVLQSAGRWQRRMLMLRLARFHRRHESQRQERARAMGIGERVRFVLIHRVFADPDVVCPTARLRDDLHLDAAGWEALRFALDTEFGIQGLAEQIEGLSTVQELYKCVEARLHEQAASAAPAEPAAVHTPDTGADRASHSPPEETAVPAQDATEHS